MLTGEGLGAERVHGELCEENEKTEQQTCSAILRWCLVMLR